MDTSRRGVIEGMAVYSSDGHKMGKVIHCGETCFEVEKGFFFPKDHMLDYGTVKKIDGDDVFLLHSKADLITKWQEEDLLGDARRPVTPQASPASSLRMPAETPVAAQPPRREVTGSSVEEEADEVYSRRRLSTDDVEIRTNGRESLNVGTLNEEDDELLDDDARL